MYFADGRPLIELALLGGSSRANHRCGMDLYAIATRLLSATVMQERWRVRGPHKTYDAVTTLVRAA